MLEKIKKRLKQVGFFAITLIILALVFAPSKEEAQAQKLERIKTLEAQAQKSIDPYDSMIFYKELLELDPANESYKKNFDKFTKLESYMENCRIKTRSMDQNFLKIPDSYKEDIRAGKFTDENTIVLSANFSGENLFKQKRNFKSMYKCTVLKDDMHINKISFLEIN